MPRPKNWTDVQTLYMALNAEGIRVELSLFIDISFGGAVENYLIISQELLVQLQIGIIFYFWKIIKSKMQMRQNFILI